MIKARVAITGTRPFLFHRFGIEALTPTVGSSRKKRTEGSAGNDPSEWKRTYFATEDGQLYIEPTYAFGALREAARFTKSGKGSIQKSVQSTLVVLDGKILMDRFMPKEDPPVNDDSAPVSIDVRGVKNPATKAKNVRYRVALSSGWKASFTIAWDPTIVSENEMRAVVNDAGALVGLGDGRAIGYGRFEIDSFEILNAEAKAA